MEYLQENCYACYLTIYTGCATNRFGEAEDFHIFIGLHFLQERRICVIVRIAMIAVQRFLPWFQRAFGHAWNQIMTKICSSLARRNEEVAASFVIVLFFLYRQIVLSYRNECVHSFR